jgi:hypothetical protein
MSAQTWNSEGYAKHARFVTELGAVMTAEPLILGIFRQPKTTAHD